MYLYPFCLPYPAHFFVHVVPEMRWGKGRGYPQTSSLGPCWGKMSDCLANNEPNVAK